MKENQRRVSDIVRDAFPLIVAGLSTRIFALTDTFWISRIGTDALNAVSLGNSINTICYFLGLIVSSGYMVPGGQALGAGDRRRFQSISKAAAATSLAMSCILVISIFVFAEGLLRGTSSHPEVVVQGAGFLRVSAFRFPAAFLAAYYTSKASLEKRGKFVAKASTLSTLANFALDPLFILGLGPIPALGVEGAALATVICNFVVVAYLYFKDNKPEERTPMGSLSDVKEILRNGIPSVGALMMVPVFGLFVQYIMNRYSSQELAAYNIGNTIFNTVFLIVVAFDNVTTANLSRLRGSGGDVAEIEASTRAAMRAISLCVFPYIVVLLAGSTILCRVLSPSPEVAELSALNLALRCIGALGVVLSTPSKALLKAYRHPNLVLLVTIVNLGLTAALLYGVSIANHHTATTIWTILSLSMVLEGVLLVVLLRLLRRSSFRFPEFAFDTNLKKESQL